MRTKTYELWYMQKLSNNLCAGSATRYCSSKRAVREGYIGEGACLCGSKVLAPPLCVFSFPYFFCTSKRNRACGAMQAPITEKIPYFTSSTLRGPILFACPKRIGRKRTFKGRALYKTLSGLPLSLPAALCLRQGKRLPNCCGHLFRHRRRSLAVPCAFNQTGFPNFHRKFGKPV